MKRRNVLLLGGPPGYRRIAAFLNEYQDGKFARTASLDWLAEALDKVVDAKPARAPALLDLKWKRGHKQGPSAADYFKKWTPVLEFVDKTIAEDSKKRGAVARALDAAEEKFGKERSVIEKAWRGLWKTTNDSKRLWLQALANDSKLQSAQAVAIDSKRQLTEAVALVKKHLTEGEIRTMRNESFRDLVRLARARRRESTATK